MAEGSPSAEPVASEVASTGRSWGTVLFWVMPLVIVLLFVAYGLMTRQSPNTMAELPRLGQPMADFAFPDLQGRTVSLSSLKGKVVFLNIWATWCQPCIDEMPAIQSLHDQLKPRGLEVLTVSIDPLGDQIVTPFVKKYGLSFPVLLDMKSHIQKLYGTASVPESFIIDKDGRLVEKIVGPRDWTHPKVIAMFQRLLEAPPTVEQRG